MNSYTLIVLILNDTIKGKTILKNDIHSKCTEVEITDTADDRVIRSGHDC